jgi:crossover junction endodeoxyribonuclease RuvC
MKIIGIDPGYERLGVAVIEGPRSKETLIFSECFKTNAKLPFDERLLLLVSHVEKLLIEHEPQLFSIENLFISTNQKTAMRVAEVRGALIYIAKKNHVPVVEFTPLQVKDAIVGYGKSDKQQVAMMVHKLIKIPAGKRLDDEYDAIALALTASACHRS